MKIVLITEDSKTGEAIRKEVYRKYGREFIKSKDDLIIAGHADPARIAKRCNSFRRFQQILLS